MALISTPPGPGQRVYVVWTDGKRYPAVVDHFNAGMVTCRFPNGTIEVVPMQHVVPVPAAPGAATGAPGAPSSEVAAPAPSRLNASKNPKPKSRPGRIAILGAALACVAGCVSVGVGLALTRFDDALVKADYELAGGNFVSLERSIFWDWRYSEEYRNDEGEFTIIAGRPDDPRVEALMGEALRKNREDLISHIANVLNGKLSVTNVTTAASDKTHSVPDLAVAHVLKGGTSILDSFPEDMVTHAFRRVPRRLGTIVYYEGEADRESTATKILQGAVPEILRRGGEPDQEFVTGVLAATLVYDSPEAEKLLESLPKEMVDAGYSRILHEQLFYKFNRGGLANSVFDYLAMHPPKAFTDEAVEGLVAGCGGSEPPPCIAAIRASGASLTPRIEKLRGGPHDSNAASILSYLGGGSAEDAEQALAKLAKELRGSKKHWPLEAMGFNALPAALEPVLPRDDSDGERNTARVVDWQRYVARLQAVGEPALGPIKKALLDSNRGVSYVATQAFSRIDPKQHLKHLGSLMRAQLLPLLRQRVIHHQRHGDGVAFPQQPQLDVLGGAYADGMQALGDSHHLGQLDSTESVDAFFDFIYQREEYTTSEIYTHEKVLRAIPNRSAPTCRYLERELARQGGDPGKVFWATKVVAFNSLAPDQACVPVLREYAADDETVARVTRKVARGEEVEHVQSVQRIGDLAQRALDAALRSGAGAPDE